MKHFIEVKEDGIPKRVPHDNDGHCFFAQKDKAKDFQKKLKSCCKGAEFRLVSCKETYTYGKWQ